MRLGFSTILVAALVFGGMLLIASRERLRHCPAVEDILAGSIPGIFETDPDELAAFAKEYRWVATRLLYAYEVDEFSAKAAKVECYYYRTSELAEFVNETPLTLSLAPGLHGAIEFDDKEGNVWHEVRVSHSDEDVYQCGNYPYADTGKSRKDCGFHILQAD